VDPQPGQSRAYRLLVACLVFACHLGGQGRPVTVQLKWYHQFQFAGYYAAQEKGFYREAGLDVRLKEGGPDTHLAEDVASGRAQFGVTDTSLILERAQGLPVVALGVIFQHSPLVLLARPQEVAGGLVGLKGRRIMLTPTDAELMAYLQSQGIGPGMARFLPHSFRLMDLVEGKVEAVSGYATNEPYQLEAIGATYRMFSPRAAGIDFYGDLFFTSEAMVKDHPSDVAAFRAATVRGWQYAMAHPEEVADLILERYSSRKTRGELVFEARQMEPLLQPDLVEVGYMNPDRWRRIVDAYRDLGMVGPGFTLDGFLYLPARPRDLTRVVWGGLVLLVLVTGGSSWLVHRSNRRLSQELRHRREMEAERRRDQEALRKAKEQAEQYLDVVQVILVAFDDRARVTLINRKGLEVLGYEAEELVGQDWFSFCLPEGVSEQVRTVYARLMAGDVEPVEYNENEVLTKGGALRLVAWRNTVLRDAEGRITGTLSSGEDITDRRRVEAERRALEAEVEHMQRLESLGRLAGGMAHDMNNVLGAILAVAETTRLHRSDDAELAGSLGHIERAAARGRDLVKSLVGFSRKNLPDAASLDMNQLVRHELEMLDRTLMKRYQLVADLEEGLPPVHGSPGPLGSALMNLCVNAVDAMPEGGTLTLRTRSGDGRVRITVEDTGEGMDAEVLRRAMEPFFTTKPVGKGTGLGLAQVFSTARAHGGAFSLQSEVGRGTRAILELPSLASGPLGEADRKGSAGLAPAALRILLVDDDVFLREAVEAMLTFLGHRVTPLAGGEEAIAWLASHPAPDLLVLDLNMPGLNGLQTLEALRRTHPALPVLLATGFLDAETEAALAQDLHAPGGLRGLSPRRPRRPPRA